MSSGYFCSYCGKEIPQATIARRKYSPDTMPTRVYCDREHRTAHEKETGTLKQMSAQGKAKRGEAVALCHRLHPRRKRS